MVISLELQDKDCLHVSTVRLISSVLALEALHRIIMVVDSSILMVLQSLHYLLESLVVVRSNLGEMLRLTSVYYNLATVYSDLLVNPELVLLLELQEQEVYLHTLAEQSLLLQSHQPKNQSSHSLVHLEIQELVLHMKVLVLYSQSVVEILGFNMHTRPLDLSVSAPRNQNLVNYPKRSILKSTVWISALINQNLIMAELLILAQLLFVLMLMELSIQTLQQQLDVHESLKVQPYQLTQA